jgi:hypothetical protein
MSTDGHTALPWSQHKISDYQQPMRVVGSDGREWHALQLHFGSGDKIVGQVEMRTIVAGYPYPDTEDETRANLALILRAVNCHDELLAALEFALPSLGFEEADRARAAIANATGSAA